MFFVFSSVSLQRAIVFHSDVVSQITRIATSLHMPFAKIIGQKITNLLTCTLAIVCSEKNVLFSARSRY